MRLPRGIITVPENDVEWKGYFDRYSGIPYITATHDVNNPRSDNVMKNIGMTYRYSYEELWQPKNFKVIFRMYQLNFDGQNERVYQKYWSQSANHFIEDNV